MTMLELLQLLADRYPAFVTVQPLAIGIHHEIIAAWPEVDPTVLKATLRRYVRSCQYRETLERSDSHRVHLDGSDAGEVTELERRPLPWILTTATLSQCQHQQPKVRPPVEPPVVEKKPATAKPPAVKKTASAPPRSLPPAVKKTVSAPPPSPPPAAIPVPAFTAADLGRPLLKLRKQSI